MEKIEVYQNLYGNLKKLKKLKLNNNFELQGNLAFFVESYYGTPEWEDVITELMECVKNKDVNKTCWLLSNAIYEAFEKRYNGSRFNSEVLMARLNNSIDLKCYSDGNLNDFEVIDYIYYPKFHLDYVGKDLA